MPPETTRLRKGSRSPHTGPISLCLTFPRIAEASEGRIQGHQTDRVTFATS